METTLNNVTISEKSKFLAAVFKYVFFFLLITAAVNGLLGFIFLELFPIQSYINAASIGEGTYDPSSEQYFAVYAGLLIGSGIFLFALMIWIMVVSFRQRGNLFIPFTLYAVNMGVLLSACTLFVPVTTVAISLGITCLTFGVMFVIGYFTKVNTSILWMIVVGLLVGALLISLFNIIWSLVSPVTFDNIYWLVSFAIFGAMMLITIIDVANMKRIAERGEGSRNLALYCAFNLYVDFIYMFIRILALVARFSGRR